MTPFPLIIHGTAGQQHAAARARRRDRIIRAVSTLLLLAGLGVGTAPFLLQGTDLAGQSTVSDTWDHTARTLTNPSTADRLAAAHAYNHRLAANQPLLGEETDPFGHPKGDFTGRKDIAYTRTLDAGDGVMGTITIPKISVRLPIRHGSDTTVLAEGAGHLYGTSLPVGGPDTHTVITAHRGLPGRLMFTRLDELQPGDPIYLTVMGDILAYRVTGSRVVDPDRVDSLRIRPGHDMLTLLTCTPYGINTQRLLVDAERATMPTDIPDPADAPRDARLTALTAGLITGLPALGLIRLRHTTPPMGRHLTPSRRPGHARTRNHAR